MANLAVGISRVHFAKIESSFDTPAAFAAGDAIYPIKLDFEPFQNFEEIVEAAGTASLQGEIKEDRGGKWTAQCYIKPAAAGTAPDIGELIKAALGTETVNAGTSVVYTLDDTNNHSLQLGKQVGSYLYEQAQGAWVEQLAIEVAGNQAPKLTFSGGYARHIWVFGTTVNGNHAAAATSIAVNQAGAVGVGALVKFGSEDNGGSGYSVTAVSSDGLTLTISPGLVNGISDGDALSPLLPTGSSAVGTPINGVQDALTIDSSQVGVIAAKYTLDTGIHPLDKESDSDRATGLARGARRVTTQHDVYYLDTETGPLLGRAWDGTERNVSHRIGPSTAGERLTVALPALRMAVSPIEVPDAEEATASISGVAHQSSSAGDELTLTFD